MNAIFDGFKWHNLVEDDKNKFAAIYADSNESNCGLPFWLGKITKIDRHRNPEEDDPDLKEAEEEPDTYEAVEIADYYQKTKLTSSGDQEGTGKYDKHLVDGAKRGNGRTAAKQVKSWVPASQVVYVFSKLSANGTIPKTDLSYIAHLCEVAWKTGGQALTGVEAFNTSLGFKTLPTPPPPS